MTGLQHDPSQLSLLAAEMIAGRTASRNADRQGEPHDHTVSDRRRFPDLDLHRFRHSFDHPRLDRVAVLSFRRDEELGLVAGDRLNRADANKFVGSVPNGSGDGQRADDVCLHAELGNPAPFGLFD
jgi:hypothetical protein